MGQAPIRKKKNKGEVKLGSSPGKIHLYFQRTVPKEGEWKGKSRKKMWTHRPLVRPVPGGQRLGERGKRGCERLLGFPPLICQPSPLRPRAGAGRAPAHHHEEQRSQMEREGVKGGFTLQY